jgi:hypothetical protein
VGGVNDRGRCHRCERWIEADSPSDELCTACYESAALSVPFDGGQAVFTPEQWTDITLEAEFEHYLDSTRYDGAGAQS